MDAVSECEEDEDGICMDFYFWNGLHTCVVMAWDDATVLLLTAGVAVRDPGMEFRN